MGINILPHHFYSQIPDIAELKASTYWRAASSMFGVQGSAIDGQVEFAKHVVPAEMSKMIADLDIHAKATMENGEDGGYGTIEAEFLYCFILKCRPSKVVQIGCGVSTSIILRAAKDAGYRPEIVCVEPYPTPFLKQANADGRIKLINEKAQEVDLNILTDLKENDFLFIDSTHTVKPGSEVNRVILEVLPRLQKGVFVHFHDIHFPFDYKRDVLQGDLFFWSESTLLHAFLANNSKYKIAASLSMLHYEATEELKKMIPNYAPQKNDLGLKLSGDGHFPSAIYLQVIE